MKQANREKLERYRFILKARSFTPAPGYSLLDVFEVIREEFAPAYAVDWGCNYCVMQMVEYAFSEMDKRKTDTITINFNE